MIDKRPLDTVEVEDHPKIELGKMEDRHTGPHLVVNGVGVATHCVGEKVHHGS
jgi:hypothetical protein